MALREQEQGGVDLATAIDRSSDVPFHFQLRKLLERQIGAARWPVGDRLPSEPWLSKHYCVSRTTVRQAMHALEQQGLIRKEKGRGAFVIRTTSGSWLLQAVGGLFDDELSRGVTVESSLIRTAVERLPEWANEALQLSDALGLTIERLRRVDGEVAVYVANHLPAEYADVLPEVQKSSTASLYGALRALYGVEAASSSRMLEAVPASSSIARYLGVPRRGSLSSTSSPSHVTQPPDP